MIRHIFDPGRITQTPLGKSNGGVPLMQEKQSNKTEQSTNTTPVVDEKIKGASTNASTNSSTNASTNKSGVHLELSKDALKELREKSNAEYNKIVDTASAKSGKLSEDVMNRFKLNIIDQAGTAKMVQANSTAQAVMALLR